MKKLFILFLCLLIISPVLAKYVPIQKEQKEQYRTEIIQSINSQIPIRKKEILNVFDEVENEKDPDDKELKIEYGIDEVLFDFFHELIDITEKYIGKGNITKNFIPNDDIWQSHEALIRYFKDNGINASEFLLFEDFAILKQKELEKKFNYPNY